MKIAFRLNDRDSMLRAIIQGWRIRRIMKTKEIQNYVDQIRDFKDCARINPEMRPSLEASRRNTSLKLIGLIDKMQMKGLWLMYKRQEESPLKSSRKSSELMQRSASQTGRYTARGGVT